MESVQFTVNQHIIYNYNFVASLKTHGAQCLGFLDQEIESRKEK